MKHAYTRRSNSKAQANMRTSRNNQCNLDMQCSSTWTQLPVGHLAHFLHVFFHRQSLYSCHVPNLDRRGCVTRSLLSRFIIYVLHQKWTYVVVLTRSLSVSIYHICPVPKLDRRVCATRSLSVSIYHICPAPKLDRRVCATRSLSVSIYHICPVPKLDRRGCATRSLSVSTYHICPAPKLDRRGCATRSLSVSTYHICPAPSLDRRG